MIVRPETRTALSGEAALFLQQALAGSLRWSFYFVLVAVILASIIALFIPAGSAHELAHEEHLPPPLGTSTPSPGADGTEIMP